MSLEDRGFEPDGFLGYTLVRLAHLLEQRIERRLKRELGISVRQFGALAQLSQDPGIGAAQLARLLLITAQSAGPLVDALEKAGLVKRDPPPRNGARMTVSLTPAGRQTLERGYAVAAEINDRDFADLPQTERAEINARFLNLIERLSRPD